jgi:hypothetical protein
MAMYRAMTIANPIANTQNANGIPENVYQFKTIRLRM